VSHPALGKAYPPFEYEVAREKIREYASAIGATNPAHFDREAARAQGFRDVVAPPMFAVVYSAGSIGPALLDAELGMDVSMLLHRGQEFVWGEAVCSGDVITTATTFADFKKRGSRGIFVFESVSTNAAGEETVRGTWTHVAPRTGSGT
jgi:acyl dehydratase